MKKEKRPFANATLSQSLFIDMQFKIKSNKPIAIDKNTQINTPISKAFIYD